MCDTLREQSTKRTSTLCGNVTIVNESLYVSKEYYTVPWDLLKQRYDEPRQV